MDFMGLLAKFMSGIFYKLSELFMVNETNLDEGETNQLR